MTLKEEFTKFVNTGAFTDLDYNLTIEKTADWWLSKFSTFIKERDSKMWGYYKSVFEEGFEGGYPAQWDDFMS